MSAEQGKPVDWESIKRDYLAGGKTLRAMAIEYGISAGRIAQVAKAKGWKKGLIEEIAEKTGIKESEIRDAIKKRKNDIKRVANQLVTAETALKSLPIGAQVTARTLADKLIEISDHLASAAEYGASVAHRLSGIAASQVAKVDDAEPERSMEALGRIGVLTKMANASSEIALNLLRANKEMVDDMNKKPVDMIERIERVIVRQ